MKKPFEQELAETYYELLETVPEGAVQIVGSKMSEEKIGIASRGPVNELRNLCGLLEGYKQTGESIFSNKASDYLSVWAEKYNPKTNETGVQISLDQRYFSWVFIEATECWDALTDEGKNAAVTLAKKVLEAEENFWSMNRIQNNRYSYSTLTRITGYALLQTSGVEEASRLFEDAVNDYYTQVRDNVNEDGSTLDYHHRDSVHYQVFNQIAWETSRRYLLEHKIFIPDDVLFKLDSTLNFCLKYISGEETHLEFVNSVHDRDRKIQADKVGKPFDKDSYVAKQLLQIIEK